jgi:phosphatidate cytidylyltransferase
LFGKDIIARVLVGAGVLIVGLLMLTPHLLHSPLSQQLAPLIPCVIALWLARMATDELSIMAASNGGRWLWRGIVMAFVTTVGLMIAVILSLYDWRLYLVLLLGTFATDSFALVGGRVARWVPGYRVHAMTSHSQSKTVEGLIAGLVLGWVVVYVSLWLLTAPSGLVAWPYIYGLAGLVPPIAVYGDFFESRMKRDYGIKDSGTCLGAHGGVLDRLDSIGAVFALVGSGMWAALHFVPL